jgi:hypothetical protein
MNLRQRLAHEWRLLAHVNSSDRPWEMPVAAALANGLPIFVGVALGEIGRGLAASLGGLVFLYLPTTRMSHRLAWLMACAFGMIACHALGLLGHWVPALVVPLLVIISTLATMICRFYAVPPPGSTFFVMAAAIGAYSPTQGVDALAQVGSLALGTVLAVAIAFVYSLHILSRRRVPAPNPPPPQPEFDFVVVDSIVIGCFVGISLLAAQALQLNRPYWVPVSCLAVIQGATLRAAWTRQMQRILGTALGLLLFFTIAQVNLGPWGVACVMTALAFVIETLVVRHYGLASIFITPLAILLVEAGRGSTLTLPQLMQARLVDTVVGAVLGLMGAACLHNPRFRAMASAALRRLTGQA